MSGTRSPFLPAPATERQPRALLIAAHGDCGGAGGNVLANELARRVRSLGLFDEVAIGFIHGSPSIEEAEARIQAGAIRLLPLFMSDGYYVRTAIPRRLGIAAGVTAQGHRIDFAAPLGLMPQLPPILLAAAQEALAVRRIDASSAGLLVVAHGSETSPCSAAAARLMADRMTAAGAFARIDIAFLEESPFLAETLLAVPRPVVVLGLFAGDGLHAGSDVRDAVEGLAAPGVVPVEQLGGYARIIEMIAADLAGSAAAASQPAQD